jgi:hypothetical protein
MQWELQLCRSQPSLLLLLSMPLEQKEIHMSEEDLELLVTLDDPGDEQEEDHRSEAIIDDDPYKVTFGQGDWTCTLARFIGTTNDSIKGLRLRRGPQDVRRDIQVPLAPSVSRRLIPFAATVLRSLALLR